MQNILSIHITDRCNSACCFCVVSAPDFAVDSVNYDDVVSFLRDSAGREYNIVNLHGGEPTMHPRLIELLGTIRDLGYREVHLQTNGLRLADQSFAAALVNSGVTTFIVSLHGDRSEVHDPQCGVAGGLARTLQCIRNLKALGAQVRTNTVVTRQNVDRLVEICQLAWQLQVDQVNLSNLHPVGRAEPTTNAVMATFEEMRGPVYCAVDEAFRSGRRISLEGFPFCVIRERMKLDIAEGGRHIRMFVRGLVLEDYDRFMLANRMFGPPCVDCAVRDMCGGVYPAYVESYGWSQISPIIRTNQSSSEQEPLPERKTVSRFDVPVGNLCQ